MLSFLGYTIPFYLCGHSSYEEEQMYNLTETQPDRRKIDVVSAVEGKRIDDWEAKKQ